MRLRRRGAATLALALAAVACASPSGRIDEYLADDPGAEPSAARATPAGADADGQTVVEARCHGEGDDRCGVVLVDQTRDDEGPRSRIALRFRIMQAESPGRPVLVIAGSTPTISIDGLDLPDRPLIEMTMRGAWPSEPEVSCPEFAWLPTNAEAGDWRHIMARCSERLASAGVDVAAYDREQRAADIVDTLDALGYDDVDVIAPGRSGLDLTAIPEERAGIVHRVLLVQPAPVEPTGAVAAGARRVLDTVWRLCDDAPTCQTHGSVDDFLTVIAGFRTDPISLDPVPGDEAGTEQVLDDVDWLDRVIGDGHDEAAALFLPELHRALDERNSDRLDAYLAGNGGSSRADGFTSWCRSWRGANEEPEPTLPDHPVFRRWLDETREFATAICDGWAHDAIEAGPGELWPDALSVVAEGGPGPSPASLREHGEVLVTPTVAAPPIACVSAAAAAWFDDGRTTDDPTCHTAAPIAGRDSPFDLIEGRYEYDLEGGGLILHTVVPDTWTDNGYGQWSRDADPLDLTSLDLYVLTDMTLGAAQDWFVDGWELEDPTTATRIVGDREWVVVDGADPHGRGQRYQAALATTDGAVMVIIMWAADDEIDDLAESVLAPALDAARLTD